MMLYSEVEDELAHFGVLGRKWGHRRNEKLRTNLANRAKENHDEVRKQVTLGTKGLREIKKKGDNSQFFNNMKKGLNDAVYLNRRLDGNDHASALAYAHMITKGYDTRMATNDIKNARNRNADIAKDWARKHSELMAMDITKVSRRDIKNAYYTDGQ